MIRFLCLASFFLFALYFAQAPKPDAQKKTAKSVEAKPAAPAVATEVKKSAPGASVGNAPQKPKDKAPTQQEAVTETQIVKVTISPSRAEVTTGGGYGVYADLQNVSPVPVTIYPEQVELIVQPELAPNHGCAFSRDAFFPTETANKDKEHPAGWPILVQPKEHYQVFWDLNIQTDQCTSQTGEQTGQLVSPSGQTSEGQAADKTLPFYKRWWASAMDSLSFVPGDYAFVVEGKAHLEPNKAHDSEYHLFQQSLKLHVGITQVNSMLSAMLGGILAYFVVVLRPGGQFPALKFGLTYHKYVQYFFRFLVILRSVFSAALLSGVVTVILSRISDTQFPVKVSVSDFWGALTIGFVAYFSGNKLIDKIVGAAAPAPGNAPNPQPSPNQPQQGPPAPGPQIPQPAHQGG